MECGGEHAVGPAEGFATSNIATKTLNSADQFLFKFPAGCSCVGCLSIMRPAPRDGADPGGRRRPAEEGPEADPTAAVARGLADRLNDRQHFPRCAAAGIRPARSSPQPLFQRIRLGQAAGVDDFAVDYDAGG